MVPPLRSPAARITTTTAWGNRPNRHRQRPRWRSKISRTCRIRHALLVGGFNCKVPINTGGTHWALDAAVKWLQRWVVKGTPPPTAPSCHYHDTGLPGCLLRAGRQRQRRRRGANAAGRRPDRRTGQSRKQRRLLLPLRIHRALRYGPDRQPSMRTTQSSSRLERAAQSTRTGTRASSCRLMRRSSCAPPFSLALRRLTH